jgi:signal transduction histidine kinase
MHAPSSECLLPRLAGMPRALGWALIAALEAGCALLDWRFSRAWPVSHLYYVPIALAGALFGFAAAIPAALASAAIFVSIDFRYLGRVAHEPDVIRLVLFLAVGLVASTIRRDARRLACAGDALKQLNTELAHANDQLRREQQLRVQYVARAAHDLAQPLTAMKAGVDLLLRVEHPQTALFERELKAISANGHRAVNMLENLMEAARIQTQGITLRFGEVDVEAVVREAAETFSSSERRDIVVEPCVPSPLIRGDARQLLRVFLNLIGNAVKYSPPNAPVRVAIDANELAVRVSVRDQGVGIAAAEVQRVLRPFARSATAARTEGFGLGLAISQEIITAHGGDIDIDSQVGGGTTVHVVLPVAGPCPA